MKTVEAQVYYDEKTGVRATLVPSGFEGQKLIVIEDYAYNIEVYYAKSFTDEQLANLGIEKL